MIEDALMLCECDGNGAVLCWMCGGAGGRHDCGEDCCACADKEEITEDCPECRGRGFFSCRACAAMRSGQLPTTEAVGLHLLEDMALSRGPTADALTSRISGGG